MENNIQTDISGLWNKSTETESKPLKKGLSDAELVEKYEAGEIDLSKKLKSTLKS